MGVIPTQTATQAVVEPIKNDGFFPDLSVHDFSRDMRLDIPDDNKRIAALKSAMYKVNEDLAPLKRPDEPSATLTSHITNDVYTSDRLNHLYFMAVFNLAKALLIENYRDIDTHRQGHEKSDQMEPRALDYQQRSRENVRQLLGKPRMTVELV
ncbi:MAG: head completion/stabilization protein [Pseudomonadota bacterium]